MATAPSTKTLQDSAAPSKYDKALAQILVKTASHLKFADFIGGFLKIGCWVLGGIFLIAIVDAWVWQLPVWARFLSIGGLIGGGLWIGYKFLLPFLISRINPLYAAKMIEDGHPHLKNSLLNYVSLTADQDSKTSVRKGVMEAVSRRAAVDASHVPGEQAIDYTPVIRMMFLFTTILVLFSLYCVLSSRSPLPTIQRLLAPFSSVEAPKRVTISNVKPTSGRFFLGDPIVITADIEGLKEDEKPIVIFDSADQQFVKSVVALIPNEDTPNQFNATIETGGNGVQKDITYRISAGDNQTKTYHLRIQQKPTTMLEKISLKFPAYTKSRSQTLEGQGDLKVLEGTEITLFAYSNSPISRCSIEFYHAGSNAQEIQNVDQLSLVSTQNLKLTSDKKATGSFIAERLQSGGSKYTHYRITSQNEDKTASQPSPVYRLEVVKDKAPEVKILKPTVETTSLPINKKLDIRFQGIDPDYQLTKLGLKFQSRPAHKFEHQIKIQSDQPNSNDGQGLLSATYAFQPKDHSLEVGDLVTVYAFAEDNRHSPGSKKLDPNRTDSKPIKIKITEAVEDEKENQENKGQKDDQNPKEDPNSGNDQKQQPPQKQEGNDQKDSEQNSEKNNQGGSDKKEDGNQDGSSSGNDSNDGNQSGKENKGENSSNQNQSGSYSKDSSSNSNSSDTSKNSEGKGSNSEENSSSSDNQENGNSSSNGNSNSKDDVQRAMEQWNDKNNEQQDESDILRELKKRAEERNRQQSGKEQSGKEQSGKEQSGKEQSGKEQSGKEQSGKEQSGKEQSGKEQSGKEQSGKEQSGKEQSGKEQSGKEQSGKEQSGKEQSGKEQSGKEQSGKEQSGKEQSGKEQSGKEQSGKEQSGKEQSGKEQSGKEQSGKEQSGKEQSGKEQSGKEQSGKEQSGKEQSGKEQSGKEQSGKEQSGKEQSGKEQSGKEQSGKEQSGKEQSGKEQSGKEQSGKEQSGKEQSGKEQSGKEQSGKEQSGKEQSGKEQSGKEQSGKEQSGKEQSGKEQSGKEQSGKEQSGKEQSGKEQSGKEQSGKEQSGKEQSGKEQSGKEQSGKEQSGKEQSGKQKSGKQQESKGNPKGSKSSGSSGSSSDGPIKNSSSEDQPPSGEDANVEDGEKANKEYADKTLDMILKYLEEEKNDPNKEMLDRFNWSKDDLNDFLKRWKEMKRKAESGTDKDRRNFQRKLQSLGLGKHRSNAGRSGIKKDQLRGMTQDGSRVSIPFEHADRFGAFLKGKARSENQK